MSPRVAPRTRPWPGAHHARASGPSDPAGTFVTLAAGPRGQGQVHVVLDEGEGAELGSDAAGLPVLTSHGIPGSVRDWRYVGPELAARGHPCVRVDMPGFGQSDVASWDAVEQKNRAAFFVALADALSVDRFVIMAHSFGGSLAMMAAALFPERVAGLIFVNSIGTLRHRGLAPIQGRLLRKLPDLFEHEVLGEGMLSFARWGYQQLGFKGEYGADELQHHMRLVQHLDFADLRWAARKVSCPALVVSTDDDPLVEPRVAHRLVSDLGEGALRRHLHLPDGGHYANKHHAAVIAEEAALLFS